MSEDIVCERLKQIPVPLVDGRTTDLGSFCGQKLVVFFCPDADPEALAKEIESYQALADQFEAAGSWLIGIAQNPSLVPAESKRAGAHLRIGIDADGSAFADMTGSLPETVDIRRETGSTFLVDRDGSIRCAWVGTGHAGDALAAARERP